MQTIFRLRLAAAALALGLATTAQAQTIIPNGTLDNWAVRNGVEAPADWLTTDDLVRSLSPVPVPSGFTTGAVTKTADARTGPFAARLETVAGGAPGSLILGNRFSPDADFPGGLPFTASPTSMRFYYKLTVPAGNPDEAGVLVSLTRTVNGTAKEVAFGSLDLSTTAASYTLADVPLTYEPGAGQPDSVRIFFYSSSSQTPTAGIVFQVDDVSFVGGLATRPDAATQALLNVAPNPAPAGRVQLSSPAAPALAAAPLAVLDATGRVVFSQPAQPAGRPVRELDLGTLPAGIYTLRLDTPHGALTRKLVTQ